MEYRATARWMGGMRFEGTDSGGQSLMMDSSVAGGGEGKGLRPVELPLIGLLGCTGIDTIEILEKMRQPVEGFELSVESRRAGTVPTHGYDGIHVTYAFRGEGLDRKKVERAVKLSEEKYCTVNAALSANTTITHTITINGE